MNAIKLTQKSFTDKNTNKIVAYVEFNLVTADFGNIPLAVNKDNKKVVNFLARQNGFKVGEVDTIPEAKEVVFQ